MLTSILFFIFILSIPSAHCSCFVQSPWTTIRPPIQMINPCLTIVACESSCLGNSQCKAYAFVNTKCMLLGPDSGKPQICTSTNPTCYVRTAACDTTTTSTSTSTTTTTTPATTTTTSPSTTTTVPSTTTSSTTSTTTSTQSTTTTTTTPGLECAACTYVAPAGCGTCFEPSFSSTVVSCASGSLYNNAQTDLGMLTCVSARLGNEWAATTGSRYMSGTQVYCK